MPNSPGIPPGFGGRAQNMIASDTAPVLIPHEGLPMKSSNQTGPAYHQSPPIAASAPAETMSSVDMLLNCSTERRSLSPQMKMCGTKIEQSVFEKSRVLSCSDLESVLTSRQYNGSQFYHQPLMPDFHHLPPIQACLPPRQIPPRVQRLMVGHNLQHLILNHQLPGQQFVRMIQIPIRPPPGFDIPVLTPPPTPLTPPQFASPQPWSPARLAPMFHRNGGSLEEFAGAGLKADTELKTTNARGQRASASKDEGMNGRQIESIDSRQNETKLANCGDGFSPKPGTSSQADKNDGLERGEEPNGSSGENNVRSDEKIILKKKREKKKRPKREKKKKKNAQVESTENAQGSLIEETYNEKYQQYAFEFDESYEWTLDDSEPSSPNNNTSFIDKEKERLRKLKKKVKKPKGVEKFEPYLSIHEVQSGLADGTLFESEIRINQKNYKEAYVSDQDNSHDIIIVGLKDRNRSLDGDIVVVRLKDKSEWARQKRGIIKSGKVVFIKERVHHRCTVGTMHMIDKGMILLVPRDQRFPLLRIKPQSIPISLLENLSTTNIENIMFKATIMSWSITRYAYGIIKNKVGKKGELESETAAIYEELGLDRDPIPDSSKYLPPLPFEIPEEEISSRLDLRSEVVFTIDPPTARDLDDAVSIKKLTDDTFLVGVHISDVTYFLHEGTQLDKIVSHRATTVYMVEEANHMLPVSMCGLCSLSPGEDKLTISVLMTIDKNGCVLDREFKRSIIHSCAQLNYDEVQDIIEGKDVELADIHNNAEVSDIKDTIHLLHQLAVRIRKNRFDGGALKIDQSKLWFTLDEENLPNSLAVYEIKDSNRLIEEFMLLANESVAKFIHDRAPDIALLRKHEPPKQDMMASLEKSLSAIGINLDSSSSGNLHKSLSKYCENDEMKAQVLYYLCARPMKRAVYFCSSSKTHHYALNMEKYTHFTSPIRRYADIVVHRILIGCLKLSPMPKWDTHNVKRFAAICNKKKFCAKRASEMSCDLYRTLYIKKVGSLTVDAVVLSISSSTLTVIVPSLAYHMKISLEKVEDINYDYIEKDMESSVRITWPEMEEVQEVRIFSCIQALVFIGTSKKLAPQIQGILLPPPGCPR